MGRKKKERKNASKPPGIGKNKNMNTVKSRLLSLAALKEFRSLALDED